MIDVNPPIRKKSWYRDREHTVIQFKGCSWPQMERLAKLHARYEVCKNAGCAIFFLWPKQVTSYIKGLGLTWSQLERKAQDRDSWRTLVGGLCPRRGTRCK